MQNIRNRYANLTSPGRRVLFTIGLTTIAFLLFTLATMRDLLNPRSLNEYIVNPVPAIIGVVGLVACFICWRGRTRLASYMVIVACIAGFLIISIFSGQPVYSTIAETMIVIIPVMIAVHSASEREFIWILILALVFRSAIQFIGTYKTTNSVVAVSAQTEFIAQWISIVVALLFGLYIAFNLNNYPFRIKMLLVLGMLTIVPTAILTSVSRNDLQTTLVDQANKSLVLTSDQLASSFNTIIQSTLDTTRVEAQSPALVAYIGQPRQFSSFGGQLFPRGTDLETVAMNTLYSYSRKDPVNIVSSRVIDNTGTIQLSTRPDELAGRVISDNFYTIPFTTGLPYVSPVVFTPSGQGLVHFGAPIRSAAGSTIGILDITYSASYFQQILSKNSNKLGTDVSSMLLDDNRIILAHSSQPDLLFKIVNPPDIGTISVLSYQRRLQNLPPEQLALHMDGLSAGLENLSKVAFFSGNFEKAFDQSQLSTSNFDQAGAAKLQSRDWYVVTYVPQRTLLSPVQSQTQRVVLISILISLLSIAVALGVTQVLVSPIISLTATSQKITQGQIDAVAQVATHDEIGELATTFNTMTMQIRELVSGLEQRVAERTQALEQRAIQLKAAADVGSAAARMRDLNDLLIQSTRLISQRFGYYHVGIFLLDELGEYAVLRASNSEGGGLMLARGHKLKVGEVGIVGFVSGAGLPRIALNVGQDATFFNNPDLPLTQSEMALPLIAGNKILGALDIQSTQQAAFQEEDIVTLKVLADQIAIAIENARLFTESQAALEAARRAYGELSREDWQRVLHTRQETAGYISYAKDQVLPVTEEPKPEFVQAIQNGQPVLSGDGKSLHLPVKIRNEAIGAIRLDKPLESGAWTEDEIVAAASLSDQLGIALDSARLYTDISQRAEREFLISEISSRIGSSIRLETILRTTVEELGHAFGDSEIVLQIGGTDQKGNNRE
jgi:GAF domain-containing protein/HAMP domain-containing protein